MHQNSITVQLRHSQRSEESAVIVIRFLMSVHCYVKTLTIVVVIAQEI